MLKILLGTIALIATFLVFNNLGTQSVYALDGNDFNAGRIIDDGNFTNYNQMSKNEIQGFLNAKSSCLKNYSAPEPLGNNNYGENVSAAQVIWKASQINKINPRVLLVTLEKESALIRTDDCASWRYRTAMGLGCPDGSPCDSQWFGFSRQVHQSARHFRAFYDLNENWWIPYKPGVRRIRWHPLYCADSEINILNRATAALYSYTPYQPNSASLNNLWGTGDNCSSYGNRNFWRDYTTWFGSTIFNIKLLRNPSSGAIYLIENNTKRQITSDGYQGWGLSSLVAPDVNQAELDQYETLTPMLDRLVKPRGDSKIYLVDNSNRYHVENLNMFNAWGLSSSDVAETWWDPIKYLGNEEKLAYIASSPVDDKIYMMDGGELKHYKNMNVLIGLEGYTHKTFYPSVRLFNDLTISPTALEHPRLKDSSNMVDEFIVVNGLRYHMTNGSVDNFPFIAQPVSVFTLRRYVNGGTLPSMMQVGGQQEIYLINNKKYQHIPSLKLFLNWRPITDKRILKLNDRSFNLWAGLEVNPINGFVAKNATTNVIYVIDSGKKRQLTNSQVESMWIGSSTPVLVNPRLLDLFVTGDSIDRVVTGSDVKYYDIDNGTKRWITTGQIYRTQYRDNAHIVKNISDTLLSLIPDGPPIE
jgi:hypothetical protein